MSGTDAPKDGDEPLRCDLCGDETTSVQRVALDRDYERLSTRHTVRYACQRCYDRKDRQRLGMERG